jgi:Flp pilus assembly protein TadG
VSNSKPRRLRHRSHRGRGQAMVEFALVLPVFLLVLCGILDFGFMLFDRMSLINAVREGARAGSVIADPTQIPAVVQARVISAATQAGLGLSASNVPGATCVETTSPTTPAPSCTWTLYNANSNPTGAQVGDSVLVTVNYDYQTFFPLLFGRKFTLSTTVQMVLESVTSG